MCFHLFLYSAQILQKQENLYRVPNCMSRHKVIAVITREHFFMITYIAYIYIYIYTYIYIYRRIYVDGFFEVAIESWPEWDLNPLPLNSVQTL